MARFATIACVALFIVSEPAAAATAQASASPVVATAVVTTKSGPVQGAMDGAVATFRGIPYAAPPTGEGRFKPPRPVAPWADILDATGYGAPAIQMYDRKLTGTAISLELATIFTTRSDIKIDNEDCLYLNVWTPGVGEGRRPVMLWIHGGGFAYGSGAWPVYDGKNLAARGDVVVVTVNHRLNVFGYLHLAALGDEYAGSGNAGMLDLVAALEWIRANVAGFGGDPGNVTIMGESGGGSKVSTLMAMPAAAGLFHRAVIQSGPGLTGVKADVAEATARAVLAELGITAANKSRLAELSTGAIVAAVAAANAKAKDAGPFGLPLAPVVDGSVLPRDPFTPAAPDVSRDVPILIGWNKDEWTLFNVSEPWFGNLSEAQLMERAQLLVGDKAQRAIALYRELRPGYSPTYVLTALMGDTRMMAGSALLAERKAAQGGAPAYMYHLTWETPVADGVFKSPHTLDIPLMFDNVDRGAPLTGTSAEARALAGKMADAWLAFARTGNPAHAGLPAWPPYSAAQRSTMVFDVEPHLAEDVDGPLRELLAN